MQCVEKVTKGFNNYEEIINRIIKEKREKNMYLKDAYLETEERKNKNWGKDASSKKETIILVFEVNGDKSNKKRNTVVQGKMKKYKEKFHFIRKTIDSMRSLREHMYITWAVDKCLEFDGKYLLFLTRKRKGYHRSKS